MYRRCADAGSFERVSSMRCIAQVAALLCVGLLTACGSNAPAPDQSANASAVVASPKSGAPGESKEETAAASTLPAAPTEPPIPPEATQQFDSALALMSSGNTAAAEQSLRSLATAYPSYSGPLLNLGILLTRNGKLTDAEQALRGAIERNANNAAAFNQLGIVYRRLGRFKEAEESYRQAVTIDPNYALAHLNLGVLCDLYLQQPQRALESYERYLALASAPDQKVTGWVTELKARLGAEPRSAKAEQ